MIKAIDLIEAVDRILDSEEKWTKNELARDKAGLSVPASSDDAVCFCLSGAVVRAYMETRCSSLGPLAEARAALMNAIRPHDDRDDGSRHVPLIPYFNDRPATTFADIKCAINVARTNELAKTLS